MKTFFVSRMSKRVADSKFGSGSSWCANYKTEADIKLEVVGDYNEIINGEFNSVYIKRKQDSMSDIHLKKFEEVSDGIIVEMEVPKPETRDNTVS